MDSSIENLNQTQNTIKTIVKSDDDDFSVEIICSNISKFQAKIMDLLFSWVEDKVLENFKTETEKQEGKNILQYIFLYKHIYGGSDLEKYLTGEDKGQIEDKGNIDKETDSNDDGISDYFTKLICNGKLTTKAGTNPFEGKTFTEIQRKKRDFDGDKLKNGEEIEIKEENGKYYIIEHSSPIDPDSDGDGVSDKNDASPFDEFNKKFKSVKNSDYIPETPDEDEKEKVSENTYDSLTQEWDARDILYYKSIEDRANLIVATCGECPGSLAVWHYLENTGATYSFDLDWELLETNTGSGHLAENTNDLMEVVESTVKDNQTICFATDKELTGTNFYDHGASVKDAAWYLAVSYTHATMTAKATNIDGNNYKMTLYYNIVDYYDWKDYENGYDFIGGFAGPVWDFEMYQLHTHGDAKQYRINIPYKMEITWKKGDRYKKVKNKKYELPNTMKVERLN